MGAATVGAASCPCCPCWREPAGPWLPPERPHPQPTPRPIRDASQPLLLATHVVRTRSFHVPLRTSSLTSNPLPSRPQELRPRSGDRRLLRPPAPLSAENNLLGRRTDRPLEEVGAPGVLLRPQQLRSCPSPPASSSGPLVDPQPTRCDLGAPPPRGRSVPAHPSSTPLDTPLISPLHSKPLSHTTSHPFASLAGSRRHRGRHVLRPLCSRMWAVFGAVWAQKEPLAQNFTLHLLVVSVLGRVAACMFVFRPAVVSCPCRAMSVRVRVACPCTAVVNLRVCM